MMPLQAEATRPQVAGEHHETGTADVRDLQSGFRRRLIAASESHRRERQGRYSLIARFEPVQKMPIPERLFAAGMRNMSTSSTQQTIVGHAHRP